MVPDPNQLQFVPVNIVPVVALHLSSLPGKREAGGSQVKHGVIRASVDGEQRPCLLITR